MSIRGGIGGVDLVARSQGLGDGTFKNKTRTAGTVYTNTEAFNRSIFVTFQNDYGEALVSADGVAWFGVGVLYDGGGLSTMGGASFVVPPTYKYKFLGTFSVVEKTNL